MYRVQSLVHLRRHLVALACWLVTCCTAFAEESVSAVGVAERKSGVERPPLADQVTIYRDQ